MNVLLPGRLNITLWVDVDAASTQFPVYISSSVANRIAARIGKSVSVPVKRVVSTSIAVSFRNCRRGEYYDVVTSGHLGSCRPCFNSYSFADNSGNSVTKCNPCPKNAVECYGSTIVMAADKWRWSDEARTIYDCPFDGSCQGGNATGLAACVTGSEGINYINCDSTIPALSYSIVCPLPCRTQLCNMLGRLLSFRVPAVSELRE